MLESGKMLRKLHKYAGVGGFWNIGLVKLKLGEREHGRG